LDEIKVDIKQREIEKGVELKVFAALRLRCFSFRVCADVFSALDLIWPPEALPFVAK
jgi:hypothetical protein